LLHSSYRSEYLIKQVTGNDTLTARILYGEYFNFVPAFKIWYCQESFAKLICGHLKNEEPRGKPKQANLLAGIFVG
jgi:hypothetical protein